MLYYDRYNSLRMFVQNLFSLTIWTAIYTEAEADCAVYKRGGKAGCRQYPASLFPGWAGGTGGHVDVSLLQEVEQDLAAASQKTHIQNSGAG